MRVYQTAISVREGQSGAILMTLRDETGDLILTADLTSITLDFYHWSCLSGTTINGRASQDVLNANQGAYFDALQTLTDESGVEHEYNFRWDYSPLDTPFVGQDAQPQQTEQHVAHFRFVWDGGAKGIGHEVRMTVTNYRRFTV